MNQGLVKNFNAGGTIPSRTIVKFGADAKTVVAAAAATDNVIGVSCDVDALTGDPTDVQLTGIALVKNGAGAITRGTYVSSDASGNAATTAPAAGTNNRSIGIAMDDAAAGDIFNVFLGPESFQG